jgi:hypothetical protein
VDQGLTRSAHQSPPVDGTDLQLALATVAAARDAALVPLDERPHGYPELAQGRWAAWRRKHRLDDAVPAEFASLLKDISDFGDPALRGLVAGRHWIPHHRAWR